MLAYSCCLFGKSIYTKLSGPPYIVFFIEYSKMDRSSILIVSLSICTKRTGAPRRAPRKLLLFQYKSG